MNGGPSLLRLRHDCRVRTEIPKSFAAWASDRKRDTLGARCALWVVSLGEFFTALGKDRIGRIVAENVQDGGQDYLYDLDFYDAVFAAAKKKHPDLHHFFVFRVVETYRGRRTEEDVEEVLGLAREIRDRCRAATAGSDRTVAMEPSYEMAVVSRVLLRSLRRETEALRRKIFGQPGPPFERGASGAAAAWVEQQYESWLERSRRSSGSGESWQDRLGAAEEHERRLRETDAIAEEFSREQLTLSYIKPGCTAAGVVAVPARSDLVALKHFVARAARSTHFSEAALVDYVLTGFEHVVPRLTVGMSFSTGPRPFEFRFTILGENLAREDFRQAFEAYQKVQRLHPGLAPAGSGRRVGKETAKMLLLILKWGGVPRVNGRVDGSFWASIGEVLGLSPDAVRKRFERLEGRVSHGFYRMLFRDHFEEET